jgi:hypothetical protein
MKNLTDDTLDGTSPALGKEKEFDYMLSELDYERHSIYERGRRIEQALTFYLTVLTAVVGGTVALALTIINTNSITFTLVLAFSTLIATVVGHLVFLAILGLIAEIVQGYSHYYARRLYFLDFFPQIRRYVVHPTDVDIREIWIDQYNPKTQWALRLFASFNCSLLSIFVFISSSQLITVAQDKGFITKFDVSIPVIVLALVVLGGMLVYEISLISRYVNEAKKLCFKVAKSLPGEGKITEVKPNPNSQ